MHVGQRKWRRLQIEVQLSKPIRAHHNWHGVICTILYWLDREIDKFRNSYFSKNTVGNPGSNIWSHPHANTPKNMGSGRSFWFAAGPANGDLSSPSFSRRSNPNSTCIWNCQIQPGAGSAQKHPNGFFCHVRRYIGYSFCLLAPGRIRPGARYGSPDWRAKKVFYLSSPGNSNRVTLGGLSYAPPVRYLTRAAFKPHA